MCDLGGEEGRKAFLAFLILAIVQAGLVAGLLACGVMGKDLDTGDGEGIPYYVGAFVVGGLFSVSVVFLLALLLITRCDPEACASGGLTIAMCCINFLGLPFLILGLVFVAVFGISSCKNEDDTGFCSYQDNLDENYRIATVSLALIILVFVTDIASFCVIHTFADALLTKPESPVPTRRNQVAQSAPVAPPTRTTQPRPPAPVPLVPTVSQLQPALGDLSHLQFLQLQQQNQEMQRQIRMLQEQQSQRLGPVPPPYPGTPTPPVLYPPAPNQDPAYPPGTGPNRLAPARPRGTTRAEPSAPPVPSDLAEDLPPSYESVMRAHHGRK